MVDHILYYQFIQKPYDKNDKSYKVIAYYYPHAGKCFSEDDNIAAVSCNVGKGKAVLCGPHPEYDPEKFPPSTKGSIMIDLLDPYFKYYYISYLVKVEKYFSIIY